MLWRPTNRQSAAPWSPSVASGYVTRSPGTPWSGWTCPALVVQGTADMRPSEPAEDLAHSLRRGELLLLPEAGHFPRLDRPEVLRQALR